MQTVSSSSLCNPITVVLQIGNHLPVLYRACINKSHQTYERHKDKVKGPTAKPAHIRMYT
eukprot:1161562-Pelagomonas_calceolata.AAC.2